MPLSHRPSHNPENRPILQAIAELVAADSWVAKRRIVETYQQELLSDAANLCLGDILADARTTGDTKTVRCLENLREVLAHCCLDGVAAAFLERVLPHHLLAQLQNRQPTPISALEAIEQQLGDVVSCDFCSTDLSGSHGEIRLTLFGYGKVLPGGQCKTSSLANGAMEFEFGEVGDPFVHILKRYLCPKCTALFCERCAGLDRFQIQYVRCPSCGFVEW